MNTLFFWLVIIETYVYASNAQYAIIWEDNMDTNNNLWTGYNQFNFAYSSIKCPKTSPCCRVTANKSNSWIQRTTNITSYHSIQLQIDISGYSLSTAQCQIWYNYDNTQWTKLGGWNANKRTNRIINFPQSNSTVNILSIRLEINAVSSNGESSCYWDNIFLKGIPFALNLASVSTNNPICYAIGSWEGNSAHDSWCNYNCYASTPYCPNTVCSCEAKLNTPVPTQNPSNNPAANPLISTTNNPFMAPTKYPTVLPSKYPTVLPSKYPTISPSINPTESPSDTPTTLSEKPTETPLKYPTISPTNNPSISPSNTPTISSEYPTKIPTISPTITPSITSENPSISPTLNPSVSPSKYPTTSPSNNQTAVTVNPTQTPTNVPTKTPSKTPTKYPTTSPTKYSTQYPSNNPFTSPFKYLTISPSDNPTTPSVHSTETLYNIHTISPTYIPTTSPTYIPTISPTQTPTNVPTQHPTNQPSKWPTIIPTNNPSNIPTKTPTKTPSKTPTKYPTQYPSESTSNHTTVNSLPNPSKTPSNYPTRSLSRPTTYIPSEMTTNNPTFQPTVEPTLEPTVEPTLEPTVEPTTHGNFTTNKTRVSQPGIKVLSVDNKNTAGQFDDITLPIGVAVFIAVFTLCSVAIVIRRKIRTKTNNKIPIANEMNKSRALSDADSVFIDGIISPLQLSKSDPNQQSFQVKSTQIVQLTTLHNINENDAVDHDVHFKPPYIDIETKSDSDIESIPSTKPSTTKTYQHNWPTMIRGPSSTMVRGPSSTMIRGPSSTMIRAPSSIYGLNSLNEAAHHATTSSQFDHVEHMLNKLQQKVTQQNISGNKSYDICSSTDTSIYFTHESSVGTTANNFITQFNTMKNQNSSRFLE